MHGTIQSSQAVMFRTSRNLLLPHYQRFLLLCQVTQNTIQCAAYCLLFLISIIGIDIRKATTRWSYYFPPCKLIYQSFRIRVPQSAFFYMIFGTKISTATPPTLTYVQRQFQYVFTALKPCTKCLITDVKKIQHTTASTK